MITTGRDSHPVGPPEHPAVQVVPLNPVTTLVHQSMMPRAKQHEVVETRLAASSRALSSALSISSPDSNGSSTVMVIVPRPEFRLMLSERLACARLASSMEARRSAGAKAGFMALPCGTKEYCYYIQLIDNIQFIINGLSVIIEKRIPSQKWTEEVSTMSQCAG